jgi:uroporphyrinogen decarboxylase
VDKQERVAAALAGRPVDRPPVSAWRHFVDREQTAPDLAEAMLGFHREFDWDFMKVNPRATYFAEAWGNRYDFGRYTAVIPAVAEVTLRSTADLARIRPVDPVGGPFGEQLEVIERIGRGLDGEAPFIQTIFSPLSVVAFLAGGPPGFSALGLDDPLPAVSRFIREDPAALGGALDAIATTLADYARAVVEAGASGIFYAIVRLARAAALTREQYALFGRPYDLRVLEAVRAAADGAGLRMNVLHICGDYVYFDDVADYPVRAINWNAALPGNPSLGEARSKTEAALMGGVPEDTTLRRGSPSDVAAAVEAAIRETDGRVLIAPGCSVIPDTPVENLRAMRDAVGSSST